MLLSQSGYLARIFQSPLITVGINASLSEVDHFILVQSMTITDLEKIVDSFMISPIPK